MRAALMFLLVSGMAWGQAADTAKPVDAVAPVKDAAQAKELSAAPAGTTVAEAPDPNAAVIPAGTKIPLLLKQAISTKNAREGDAVYAETAFPFVLNERVLVPAGTYIQGKIMQHRARGAGLEAGGNPDSFHVDDLSDRLYRDVSGIGGEHARRG
jgi:hypothetical protein